MVAVRKIRNVQTLSVCVCVCVCAHACLLKGRKDFAKKEKHERTKAMEKALMKQWETLHPHPGQ